MSFSCFLLVDISRKYALYVNEHGLTFLLAKIGCMHVIIKWSLPILLLLFMSIMYYHHPGVRLTMNLSCCRLLYTNMVTNVLDIKRYWRIQTSFTCLIRTIEDAIVVYKYTLSNSQRKSWTGYWQCNKINYYKTQLFNPWIW